MIEKRLFIVSNRLPLQVHHLKEGIVLAPSPGPIADSISDYIKRSGHGEHKPFSQSYWAGITECSTNEWNDAVGKMHQNEFQFLPVFVNKRVYDPYYNGFANSVLWPLFQGYTTSFIFNPGDFDNYLNANNEFLNTIFRHLLPNDIVWIQGYHLMPLPAILRKALPEITIIYSIHIPFPSFKVLKVLPGNWLDALVVGMMGADMISFSNSEYISNFSETIQKTMLLDCEKNIVFHDNRLIRLNTLPSTEKIISDSFPNDRRTFFLNHDQSKEGEPEEPHFANEKTFSKGDQQENPDSGHSWIADYFSQLEHVKKKQQEFQVKFLDESTKRNIFDKYRNSRKRLIFLDYDGTLVQYFPLPLQASPSGNLLDLLGKLCRSNRNEIFIISGRDADSLENWMGFLPLNFIAEHGARIKWRNSEWQIQSEVKSDWKIPVRDIMQGYVADCPNSFIEEKDFSMVWHYRNVTQSKALTRSGELMATLKEYGSSKNLKVISGNKIVEVRNNGIDKGAAVQNIIAVTDYDFILAAGDDKTDEDMFKVLANTPEAVTIKIGSDASYAKYNLHTPQMAISLLEAMSNL